MIIPVAQQANRIVQLIKAQNSSVIPDRSSVIHDTFVLPMASTAAWSDALIAYGQSLQSLDLMAAALTDTDMLTAIAEAMQVSYNQAYEFVVNGILRFGANYGCYLKPATAATAFISIYSNSLPTSDISIAAGLGVETAQGVKYYVPNSLMLTVDSAPAFYDATLDAYAIQALAECSQTGTAGNTGTETIVYFSDTAALVGIDGVTNLTEVSSGFAQETITEFIARVKLTISGTSLQTSDGIAAEVLKLTSLPDVYVVDAQSPYSIRNDGYGGVVDVYTRNSIPVSTSQTMSTVTQASGMIFALQPVIDILSVSYQTDVYVKDTDFILTKDTRPALQGSSSAQDRIEWLTANHPPDGSDYTVNYVYNQAVQLIKSVLAEPSLTPLMGDVVDCALGREGTPTYVGIQFSVVLNSAAARATVLDNAVAAVYSYISGLGFGDALAISDVVGVLEGVAGIATVNVTPIRFAVYNTTTNTYGANLDTITPVGASFIKPWEIVIG